MNVSYSKLLPGFHPGGGGGGGELPPKNLGQLYRKVYKAATPISWSFPPKMDETLIA